MLRVVNESSIIKISDDINTFKILFGGNGDLCFAPVVDRDRMGKDIPIYFNINKEDGFLFESFKKLYSKICNYEAFDQFDFLGFSSEENSSREKEYQRRKDSNREYPLVTSGIISWHSDDDISDISSILNIRKLDEESLQLEFIKSRPSEGRDQTYSIRFCNDGSRYDPFNCRFMELYNSLCSYYTNEKDSTTGPILNKTYK